MTATALQWRSMTADHRLNKQQGAAATHGKGPLLIIAGAGTGKTTVITHRIKYLIENGADPAGIVALSFTEKAAFELQQRTEHLTRSDSMFVGTFHGFCQQILEQYGLDIGLPSPFKLLTPPQSWQLFKKNLNDFDLLYYRPYQNPTSLISSLLVHFSRCQDELISPQDYLNYAQELRGDTDIAEYRRSLSKSRQADEQMLEYARIDEVASAYHTFEQLKLKRNSLDFGDLLSYANQLFKKRPNIGSKLKERYQYILIDEFQDTNWAQYQLIRHLSPDGSGLTMVADDDQSIYKWRGASVSNVLAFTKDYPDTKTIVLKENYRSGQNILDAAYQLITNNNPDRLEVQRGIDKKLSSNKEFSGSLQHHHAVTAVQEVSTVTSAIIKLLNEGALPETIAILARANAHLNPFLNALQKASVPCYYGAAKGLFKARVVIDCLAILRAVSSSKDQNAWYRFLKMPPFYLSHEDQSILWSSAERKGKDVHDLLKLVRDGVISLSQDGHNKIKKLYALVTDVARMEKNTQLGSILLHFLEQSGYLKHLTRAEQSGDPVAVDDLLKLKAFFDMLQEQPEDVSAKEFLMYVEDLLDSGEQGTNPTDSQFGNNAVTLLTAHSAKGLEFDHVFIVNMVEQRFPSRSRKEKITIPDSLIKEDVPPEDHHMQEERRLFYVALTRARKTVMLTSAQYYGGKTERKISRFISEAEIETTTTESLASPLTKAGPTIEKKPSTILPIPKTFSHSQLRTYRDCPLAYKYAHVLGIRSKQSAAMVFGNTIHAVLQRFYERVKELNATKQADLFGASQPKQEGVMVPNLQELLAMYKELWRDDWFKSDAQRAAYFKEGQNMLQLFYQTQQEKGWSVPLLLERGFKLKVGTHTLRGFIDRVDKDNEALTIIDYKTGRPKERLSAQDKQQLLLYQMATQSMPELKTSESVQLTYYYLQDGSQKSFEGTPEDLSNYKDMVLTLISRIESQDFKPTPNPMTCGYCEFKDICEFRA